MIESTDPVRAALSIPVHIDTLMQLDGRVAAVTGTPSGLGQRFARVLDAAGASVILASRRHDADIELAATLRDALAVRCDVCSPTDRQRLVTTAIERFGQIDILVNNAGIAHSEPAETEPEERVRHLLETNLAASTH
jgi:NAD(P)-dependent dehydrogenase (short-subunit alcohol dehydrogenase family)